VGEDETKLQAKTKEGRDRVCVGGGGGEGEGGDAGCPGRLLGTRHDQEDEQEQE
jgi:hypothetical protein